MTDELMAALLRALAAPMTPAEQWLGACAVLMHRVQFQLGWNGQHSN